ncbi:MAG: prepilin-type N-terminal cleavage/methylation domain-containing protein [Bacteriovorax sp.]|nr:prepilin-type N-terminal cleavage/methylation domain-containing protein [Bacteriovorax sp.]
MRFFKLIRNKKGFTLPEVLIAAAVMGVIALGLTSLTKQQAETTVKSKVNAELTQLKNEIFSILSNPNNCNANFYNKLAGATIPGITAINYCSTATSCTGAGTPLPKFPAQSASWLQTVTKISDRVRITAISITVTPAITTSAVLSNAQMSVTVENKNRLGVATPKADVLLFNVPVVLGSAGLVTGCPKSWNTTNVY